MTTRTLATIVLALTVLGCDSRPCAESRCHTMLVPVPIGDTVVVMPVEQCRCVRRVDPPDGG